MEGILYAITENELGKLGSYEGVRSGHYSRHLIAVERRNTGALVTAVTYVANPSQVRDGLKPTRAYLGHLLAAKDYLSQEYVRRLQAVQTLD